MPHAQGCDGISRADTETGDQNRLQALQMNPAIQSSVSHDARQQHPSSPQPVWVFFFPHVPPSGVSSCFAQLAQALQSGGYGRVKIVDYKNGAMARLVGGRDGIDNINYRRDQSIEILAEETLVMQ